MTHSTLCNTRGLDELVAERDFNLYEIVGIDLIERYKPIVTSTVLYSMILGDYLCNVIEAVDAGRASAYSRHCDQFAEGLYDIALEETIVSQSN